MLKDHLNTKDIRHIRAFVTDDVKAVDADAKRIRFVVRSEVIDRSDEVVEAAAVFDAISRKGQFVDNPICLAGHLHRLDNGAPPAVGYWDTATAKLTGRQGKQRVEMDLQFDTEYTLGSQYWTVYKNRTMRAVSIGFRVLAYRVEDRDNKRIFVVEKLELIEISCVAVGCNQQALATLKQLGLVDADPAAAVDADAVAAIVLATLQPTLDAITASIDELVTLHIPGLEDDLSVPVAELPYESDADKTGQPFITKLKAAFNVKETHHG